MVVTIVVSIFVTMVNYRDLLVSVEFKRFLKTAIKNNLLYRYGYVECNVFTDVSGENKDISTSNLRRSRRTSTNFTLREKCPNTEFFLVRIFLYSY